MFFSFADCLEIFSKTIHFQSQACPDMDEICVKNVEMQEVRLKIKDEKNKM